EAYMFAQDKSIFQRYFDLEGRLSPSKGAPAQPASAQTGPVKAAAEKMPKKSAEITTPIKPESEKSIAKQSAAIGAGKATAFKPVPVEDTRAARKPGQAEVVDGWG